MAVHFGIISPAPTSTGNHSVTGLPFQPVAVIFWVIEQGLTTPSNSFGVATGSSNQWVMWTGMMQQTSGYTQRYQELRNDQCIRVMLAGGTPFSTEAFGASFVSLDASGFTINVTTANNPEPVHYMALGGNNISDAHAGTFARGSATGSLAITGVGFQPDALIVGHVASSSFNTQGGGMSWGLGFSDGTNHYSNYAFGNQALVTTGSHIHRTDSIACAYIGSIPADYLLALTSFDSDGLTVNCTNAWVATIQHGYLAIKAAAAKVGNGVAPDATGVEAYTTPGFEPGGVMFAWNGADTPSTSGASTMPVRPGVGGMTSSNGGSISLIHRASAPFGAYVPDSYMNSPEAINIYGIGSQVDATAHDPVAVAEFQSFSMGEFELDWTGIEASLSPAFGWLALPGDLEAPWIPRIYRRNPGW